MTTDYITPQEADELIAALPIEHSCIVIAAAETGFRIGDLCKAKWSDYDLTERTLTLREEKTGKQRTVTVPPRLEVALGSQRKRQSMFEVFMFPGKPYHPVSRSTVWRWVVRTWEFLHKDDKRTISPHSFRKMYAVEQRKDGKELWEIQLDLNHERIDTTIKYAFADLLVIRAAEQKYQLMV